MNPVVFNRSHTVTALLTFGLLLGLSGQSGCGGGFSTRDSVATPLPIACDSAASVLTRDWLDANLTVPQRDSLKLSQNRDALSGAVDFASLESVFSRSGVPDLRSRLVERRIKSDLACHLGRMAGRPAHADSLIFPSVKRAILQFLQ